MMILHGLSSRRTTNTLSRFCLLGFTLIEVMIVVAILGVTMAVSLPAINNLRKHAPMTQTLKELREVCSHARARAIFNGNMTQVAFRPQEGTFSIGGGGGARQGAKAGKASTTSGTIHESLSLEMLDINLMEFKDEPLAVVNFYPNGTCDELTIILHSEENEWRKLSLEVTTGLTTVGPVQ